MKFLLIAITLFFLFIPTDTYAQRNTIIMSDEELALRQWSLNAVSQLMTYKHDNFPARLNQNKHLLTKKGCYKFLWIQDIFEIREGVEKREETVIAGPNPRYTLKYTIGMIELKRLGTKRVEKLGLSKGAIVWDVDVPLSVEFRKGKVNTRYRFIASVKVQELDVKANSYVILNWTPRFTKKTMKPTLGSQKFKKSKYKECDSLY